MPGGGDRRATTTGAFANTRVLSGNAAPRHLENKRPGRPPIPPGSSVPAILKPSKGFQRAGIPRNRRAGILTHER